MPIPNTKERDSMNIIGEEILHFTIGFNAISDIKSGEPEISGSGTLVKIGEVSAILTADHVLTNLKNFEHIGLILGSNRKNNIERTTLDMNKVNPITIGNASLTAYGPDLAILVLPPNIASTIASYKTFYNLDTRINNYKESPKDTSHQTWSVCGFASEWASTVDSDVKYKSFRCANAYFGTIDKSETRDVFDYIEFTTERGNVYEGPNSFQGYSGAGLWRIALIEQEDGSFITRSKILSGLVYYESPLYDDDSKQTIYCHGPKSIYNNVINAISDNYD